ncbi:MAG: AIR synthase-related protein, partial [Gemmatimonadetes bacterium]|nr:AIR synthase-related protein [Gemmatimonadota bacterium]
LGPDLDAVVDVTSWKRPPEFDVVAQASGAEPDELFRTLNMGVGMIAIVRPDEVETVTRQIQTAGCHAFECGALTSGEGIVRLEGA